MRMTAFLLASAIAAQGMQGTGMMSGGTEQQLGRSRNDARWYDQGMMCPMMQGGGMM